MTWGDDYHNESLRAQTGMLPPITPRPGEMAARTDFEAQQRQSYSAASTGWTQPGAQPQGGGRAAGPANPAGLALLAITGIALYAIGSIPVEPVVQALTLAAPLLLPAVLGTLLFGPRWPLGAMLAGLIRRVARTALAVVVLGLTLLAGAATFLATLHLIQNGLVSLGALQAGAMPQGWALAWLCVAVGGGLAAVLLGAGTWRLATGLGGGAAVAVVLVAAVYGAAIGIEFPSVEPDARYFENIVASLLAGFA